MVDKLNSRPPDADGPAQGQGEKTLRDFVQHDSMCLAVCWIPDGPPTTRRCVRGNLGCLREHEPCSCGLDKLLAAPPEPDARLRGLVEKWREAGGDEPGCAHDPADAFNQGILQCADDLDALLRGTR